MEFQFMCNKFDKSPLLCGLGVEWIAMLAGHTTQSGDERKLDTKCRYCCVDTVNVEQFY